MSNGVNDVAAKEKEEEKGCKETSKCKRKNKTMTLNCKTTSTT